ncbi:peptidylprolyl isomerase [filamentous cyanobacterium LEGE 11480]|uniref:peptidylprolyl isomerase n=1 Tax=Romeriopsis navalis LEGE 11480 TaxID=2777977 RepID=A0A928VQG7_9CYAN|nr:peptidylprolyl isomerase [Romeriopsis navalis]MBE9031872.1 peptidylprolyl isomerase [Romeriopsis navalis LEGE 11480]
MHVHTDIPNSDNLATLPEAVDVTNKRSSLVSKSEYLDVTPEDVVRYVKKQFRYRDIAQGIFFQRLVSQAAESHNLIVDAEEIQVEADQFRYDQHLENAADTLAWLEDQQVTSTLWEESIVDHLMASKLSDFLFAANVEGVFATNRLNYDRAVLYQIVVPYEQIAAELFYQIEEDEISFYEAAHLYDIDQRRRQRCGFEGEVERIAMEPAIAAVVFGAQPRQVTSPTTTDLGYHLFWIEEFIPAELTTEIRQEIINQLFQQWLQGELNYRRHA